MKNIIKISRVVNYRWVEGLWVVFFPFSVRIYRMTNFSITRAEVRRSLEALKETQNSKAQISLPLA